MAKRQIWNPVRHYKDNEGVTYVDLAERLGISEDYARKLGAGLVTSVSPAMARQFEDRTDGRIKYIEMMRWVEAHLDGAAA
jgi:hypothetical protein